MSIFTEVDRLKKELDELRPISPEQEARILQKFRLEWNYNSNAIEGNSLTLGETRSLLLHGLTAAGKPIRDHLDIKGHNEAVVWLEEIVQDERSLTEQFIRGMHQVLLGEPYEVKAQTPDGQPTSKMIHPGRYKSSPNNVLTATGEMFYFASPEETPAKMTDLVDWYRQETEQPTFHPVALAAEFHYRFVRIHPFDDGNGRMSRLLMNLILMRGGYPMTVIRATDRNRYLAALAEADAGEIEPFFSFISENVAASLQLMIRAAKGESIDEPDDLDKKLALLKKQLANPEELGKATWNPNTQTRIYENIINFWIKNLRKELIRFDDLFTLNFVRLEAQDTSRQYFQGDSSPNISDAIVYAFNVFTNGKRLVENAKLTIYFKEFRSLLAAFSFEVTLQFKFSKHNYQTLYSIAERKDNSISQNFKLLIETTYLNNLNESNIIELNHRIAEDFFNIIRSKLIEIDSHFS